MILAAQPVVVDPRYVRDADVHTADYPGIAGSRAALWLTWCDQLHLLRLSGRQLQDQNLAHWTPPRRKRPRGARDVMIDQAPLALSPYRRRNCSTRPAVSRTRA